MKFQFPLKTVMRHRKLMENEAQRVFQEANAKLNAEISKLEFLHEQVREARQKAFQLQVKGGATTNDLRQVDEFIRGQDIRIDRQNLSIQNQQQIVEDLRQILRKAAIDYKMIEKLRDKKRDEFRIESRKHEQKQIDELTNARENLVEEE
jgi:flagellar FliJ protein